MGDFSTNLLTTRWASSLTFLTSIIIPIDVIIDCFHSNPLRFSFPSFQFSGFKNNAGGVFAVWAAFVVLWCFFSRSEKIHNSTFQVKISVKNVIFSNEMDKKPRYSTYLIFHRIWKKYFYSNSFLRNTLMIDMIGGWSTHRINLRGYSKYFFCSSIIIDW